MRYIYIDEAGIDPKEPVTIVAGIIVDADHQWRSAEKALKELLDAVPDEIRPGFIFHAKAVSNGYKWRETWSEDARAAFLHEMMALPRKLKIPISLGMIRRTMPVNNDHKKLSAAQWQHVFAFYLCVNQADQYIRDYGEVDEVATVIAEDNDISRILRLSIKAIAPIRFSADKINLTQQERATGVIEQPLFYMIKRVVDGVHFVGKEDGPLLQLADACAFGFRRYFSGQSHGDEYLRSILGTDLVPEDWAGDMNGGIFHGHPKGTNHSEI